MEDLNKRFHNTTGGKTAKSLAFGFVQSACSNSPHSPQSLCLCVCVYLCVFVRVCLHERPWPP